MPSYNFKKEAEVFVVYSGSKHRLDISSITCSQTFTEQSYSVIGGPRANVGAIAPVVKAGLDAEYTLYGSTGVSISGLSGTYDIIDTTIYVQGSIVTLQIPFRIVRIRT